MVFVALFGFAGLILLPTIFIVVAIVLLLLRWGTVWRCLLELALANLASSLGRDPSGRWEGDSSAAARQMFGGSAQPASARVAGHCPIQMYNRSEYAGHLVKYGARRCSPT
jgi:hypothetical protein